MSLRRVRKRSGVEVPFDKAKIASAVRAAQVAVGEEDPAFATEVADLVELALRRRYAWRGTPEGAELYPEGPDADAPAAESVPDIEEIQDLVEVGLIELGRAAVAKAYILYRDRRGRARSTLERETEAAGGTVGLRVREAHRTSGWSKSRIVAALVREADLSRAQAEEVATRVEARVVSSGLRRLSTGLIREMVDNELVALGLAGALARQAPVSVPRHDLRELLASGPAGPQAPASVREALGGELLQRYALDDVLGEAAVERHLAGELHVEDLRAPHLYLTQGVPAELLLRGEPSAQLAFDGLEELAGLLGSVSRGLVIEQAAPLLQPLTRTQRSDGSSPLAAWLLACSALSRASGRRIDLAGVGPKSGGLLRRLLEELDRHDTVEHLPRLFLAREELEAHLGPNEPSARLERLLARGLVRPTWAPKGERFAGPAGRRAARELGGLACGGAVALNLARVMRRAGPWREDLVLEGVAHLVEAGLEALSGLAVFQREARGARPGEVRGRVGYAIVPIGLAEGLRALGDGELRPEAGARILGLVAEAARRHASSHGLSVHLSPHHGQAAAARFALADEDLADVRQGLLFSEAAAFPGGRAPSSYTPGYDLGAHPGAEPGLREGTLLATVPAGVWSPPPSGAGEPTSGLAAWRSFTDARDARLAPAVPAAAAVGDSFFPSEDGASPRAV